MSPAKYAENTTVSVASSQAEIAKVLVKYGADGFGIAWEHGTSVVNFRIKDRVIRFTLTDPDPKAKEFHYGPGGRQRTDPKKAYDDEVKRRWRALFLAIKAKLEVIETGIATIEDEFLAYTVMPDGRTVAESIQPRITEAIESGRMPTSILPQIGA